MTNAKAAGRVAGRVYLCVVGTGVFTLAYAPSRLVVEGDAAATAAAISQNAALFDASVYAGLAMCAFFLALPFALSRFLSAYGKIAALLMIAFVVASLPPSLFALAQKFEIMRLFADGAAEPAAVAAHLAAYDRWMDVASVFWGLWLAPLGWLVLKSGAIPRILGLLLIAGCAGYLANYFGPILNEGYDALPWRRWISKPGSIGEIGTCLWLVAMGARAPR
ncbi:MAG: DUF4386 domain-containing protein [Parvularculaceae bacterium]